MKDFNEIVEISKNGAKIESFLRIMRQGGVIEMNTDFGFSDVELRINDSTNEKLFLDIEKALTEEKNRYKEELENAKIEENTNLKFNPFDLQEKEIMCDMLHFTLTSLIGIAGIIAFDFAILKVISAIITFTSLTAIFMKIKKLGLIKRKKDSNWKENL